MSTRSVTLPAEVIDRAEEIAQRENRTLGELVSEALRAYERKAWWDAINVFGRESAEAAGVRDEQDVLRAIHDYRRERRLGD
jgi:predicted transcriptional regulator